MKLVCFNGIIMNYLAEDIILVNTHTTFSNWEIKGCKQIVTWTFAFKCWLSYFLGNKIYIVKCSKGGEVYVTNYFNGYWSYCGNRIYYLLVLNSIFATFYRYHGLNIRRFPLKKASFYCISHLYKA